MRYAIKLTQADGVYLVSSRDLAGLNTYGDTVEDALANAAEAMALVLQYHIDEREPLPVTSEKKRGEHWVELSPLQAAKAGLYEAMRVGKVRKSELIRKLGTQAPQVDRLLDLTHKSKLEHVVAALDVLGYRVNLTVEPAQSRRAA